MIVTGNDRRNIVRRNVRRETSVLAFVAASISGAYRPPDAFATDYTEGSTLSSFPSSSVPPLDGAVRSVASVDSHPVIPVWPTWGGGRVVPVSLGGDGGTGPSHDPFLLLAHHKHWFDPRDPLREPFKSFGSALGLPYVDVEGFSMHPHRGFDILTYVLDGSDGFRHRDSLGGSRTYRGGAAQWMRTGSGVLHEEFWETRDDRRTDVELFQVWTNLPAERKFDEPRVGYVGTGTDDPWAEDGNLELLSSSSRTTHARAGTSAGVVVRDIGSTVDRAATKTGAEVRPAVRMLHARMCGPDAEWRAPAPRGHSAILYIREGSAALPYSYGRGGNSSPSVAVAALQTATFAPDGDMIVVRNTSRQKGGALDVLLLTGEPLREPVAMGGPVVMNTGAELQDAYRQLQEGTFLDREVAVRQQAETNRRYGRRA